MATYSVEVTYTLGHTQKHEGLSGDQMESGAYAFAHDLAHLEGRGITRLVISIELTPEQEQAKHLAGWARGTLQSHILHDHPDHPMGLLYTDPLDLVHEALHVGRG